MDIDRWVGEGCKKDLAFVLSGVRNGKVRLVRLPVAEFNEVIGKAIGSMGVPMPFQPKLLGVPVDMTEREKPEVVVVYDDDTNAAKTVEGVVHGEHS